MMTTFKQVAGILHDLWKKFNFAFDRLKVWRGQKQSGQNVNKFS